MKLLKNKYRYINDELDAVGEALFLIEYETTIFNEEWLNKINEQIVVADEVIKVLEEKQYLIFERYSSTSIFNNSISRNSMDNSISDNYFDILSKNTSNYNE